MSLIRTDVAWRRRDEWQRRDFLRFFLVGADHKTRWAFGAPDSPVRLAQVPTGLHGAEFEHDYQNFVGMDGIGMVITISPTSSISGVRSGAHACSAQPR